MTWLWAFLRTSTGRYALIAFAAIAGFLGLTRSIYNDAENKHEREALENEVEAHDRINHAQTGDTLDDDGRREWLQRYGSNEYRDQ